MRAANPRPAAVVDCVRGIDFIVRPLLDNPQRVGKRLRPSLDDRHSARRGTYRRIYRIDQEQRRVTIVGVVPRSDAYP